MAGKFVKEAELESDEATPFSRDGIREYRRVYKVVCNTKEITSLEVCMAPGIPYQWSPYTSGDVTDSNALCHTISAARQDKDDWQVWLVTCVYSNEMPSREIPSDQSDGGRGNDPRNQSGSGNDPTKDMPEYSWDSVEERLAPPFDLNGDPFLNSSFQPFKPAPTVPVSYPIFVMERNEDKLDEGLIRKYAYAVNTDKFMGAPPGFVQCEPIKARIQWRGRRAYWRTTYRLKFHWMLDPENAALAAAFKKIVNPKGAVVVDFSPFEVCLLDQGVSILRPVQWFGAAVAQMPIPIVPAPAHPVMLDGAGQVLKQGQPPVFIRFLTCKRQSFAKLFGKQPILPI